MLSPAFTVDKVFPLQNVSLAALLVINLIFISLAAKVRIHYWKLFL